MTHLPDQNVFHIKPGRISLVGAGPGAADLLTARAVQRIQDADVIFHDRLVDAEVLSLIPPHIRIVNVGKEVGRCAWPQELITARIVDAAQQGLRVVRLKSGDPSVFGRAAEEISAAHALGLEIEVVPGVTAASAAAAAMLSPLTERNRSDRLLMMTATTLAGGLPQDIARSAGPGTRLAIYMGVHLCAELQEALLGADIPPDARVSIAQAVSTRHEKFAETTLRSLARTVKEAGISNPAIIFVDVPARAKVRRQVSARRGDSAVTTCSSVLID